MPNQKNKDNLTELKEKVAKAKSMTFVDYMGLKANDFNNFRSKVREDAGESVIARNTLVKIALNEEGYTNEEIDTLLKGPTAVIFSYEDPIATIRTIYKTSKELELPKVKFALVEGTYATSEEVQVLSELPSKEELIAKVVGGLKSPLSGIVNVLGGTQRQFVTVLSEIAKSKE